MSTNVIQIQAPSPANQIAGKYTTHIYVKKNWADSWQLVHYAYCMNDATKISPGVGSATIRFDFGRIKREDVNAFADFDAVEFKDYYVKVVGVRGSQFPEEQTMWVGQILDTDFQILGTDASNKEAGIQFMMAMELSHQLDRATINGARIQQDGATVQIGFLPLFNEDRGFTQRIFGNRSASVGDDGVFVFGSDADTNEQWSFKNILDYLLQYHQPGGPVFQLAGQVNSLANMKAVVFLDGMSVKAALDKLIHYDRGLTYTIQTTGEGVVSINIMPVTGKATAYGDEVLDRNTNHLGIIADDDIWVRNAVLRQSTSQKYEKIIVQGKRLIVCCSFDFNALENLEVAWTPDELAAYVAENDDDRQNDKHDRVFRYFRVPKTWDWLAGDPFDATLTKTSASPVMKKDGTLNPNEIASEYEFSRSFVSFIPVLKPAEKNLAEPEFMEPTAWVLRPRFEGLVEEQKWIQVSEWDFSVSLRMADREMAFQLHGRYNHLYGLNHFNSEASPTSQFLPMFDYEELILTAAFETSERLKIEEVIRGNTDVEAARVLTINVPDAEMHYIVPGTVIPTSDDSRERHKGGIVRDDSARLRAIAARAKAWYSITRASIAYTESDIAYLGLTGRYLQNISSASRTMDINTVISSVSHDYASKPPTTTIHTGYSDIDFVNAFSGLGGGEVDIPGLSDARSVAKQIIEMQNKIRDLERQDGAKPIRYAVAPFQEMIDDKHAYDAEDVNNSTPIMKQSTKQHGHLHDHEWLCADDTGVQRVHWHINESFVSNEGVPRVDVGGYVAVPVAPTLTAYTRADTETPIGHNGRIGDVITLPGENLIMRTVDKWNFVKVCMRHDMIVFKSASLHGRFDFENVALGQDWGGLSLLGWHVPWAPVANTDTKHAPHETIQWRVEVTLPIYTGQHWTQVSGGWTDGPIDRFTIPQQQTLGRMQVLAFQDGVDEMMSGEHYVIPRPDIVPYSTPLGITATFVAPNLAGEILVPANAVFRFNVHTFRDGDTASIPTYTNHGRVDVPIAASTDEAVVKLSDLTLDARQFNPADIVEIIFWRDYADPDDTAVFSVSVKNVEGLIEKPAEPGHNFNFIMDDETTSTISAPMIT